LRLEAGDLRLGKKWQKQLAGKREGTAKPRPAFCGISHSTGQRGAKEKLDRITGLTG